MGGDESSFGREWTEENLKLVVKTPRPPTPPPQPPPVSNWLAKGVTSCPIGAGLGGSRGKDIVPSPGTSELLPGENMGARQGKPDYERDRKDIAERPRADSSLGERTHLNLMALSDRA